MELAMDFLKKLFGGGGGARTAGDPDGLYFFVQPNGCDEVVRIRVNRNNDLSLSDDGKSYWVHKLARGVKCRQQVEVDLYFDSSRRMTSSEISGGTLVTEADYETWTASQNASQP
jgi:hypothetical protein